MSSKDGAKYAPVARAEKVCEPGEFKFAAVGLTHGHIYGMCDNLVAAGAEMVAIYDENPRNVEPFAFKYPDVKVADSLDAVLEDPSIKLVASADIPSLRGPLGIKAHAAGKHFFVDKAPFTTLEQLRAAEKSTAETGLKWGVCYSERLQNEAAILAGQIIEEGRIGKVLQVLGMGPHRLNAPTRAPYFFRKDQYGGILCDIGSHQIEQFLYYTGATDAEILSSAVANYNHPEFPELEDFGDARLLGDNGASGYFRIDWFNPDGLSSWGDGRTFILGTEGYMELRKYVNVAQEAKGNNLYLVDGEGEHYIDANGLTGFPYFGAFIRDCLDGTENAMSQRHAFKAAELCLVAQRDAKVIA